MSVVSGTETAAPAKHALCNPQWSSYSCYINVSADHLTEKGLLLWAGVKSWLEAEAAWS